MRRLSCLVVGMMACSPGATDAPKVPEAAPRAAASAHSSEPSARPAAARPPASALAPTAPQETITLFVREQRVDCQGEMPRKCLQVRNSPSDPWTNFYDSIAGFQYEESFRYELRVSVDINDHPPADKSSRSYRLIEVISKEPVTDPPR
ncbi:MAG TPA: DUF4377 domain-containing protein [Polyangiaceae bacterium]|nr:DUF4377 domain-containing protein [Polyangiaceae bacterium]